MKKVNFLVLLALATSVFFSCEKDENNDSGDFKTVTIPATSYTDFVYFSFETGGVVDVTDRSTSLDWDLGFLRYHPRTNSGSSGSGEGGVANLGAVSFESVVDIPTTFTVDDTIQISDPTDPTHQNLINKAGSSALEAWGELDMSSPPPTFIPSNNIFVVKTAKGKYAKVWLKSYYSNEGASGNITIDYVYLSGDETSFK